jgi:hypothetical protein
MISDTELDALVARLKRAYTTFNQPHVTRLSWDSVSAIAALRQERDAARAELARQNEANDMIARERDAFAATRKEWVDYCAAAGADLAAARAEVEALRALLLEFRKATQRELDGQMYTLSGIPRELTRRIDAALAGKEQK